MQGNWANGQPYYRCRFPQEYALVNHVQHPLNVYLRESDLLEPLDDWLAEAFAPDRIRHTLAALEQAQPDTDIPAEAARRTLADCDRKLARHRAALEAGADPALVAAWSRDVQTERDAAQTSLDQLTDQPGNHRRMSQEEIRTVVEALGSLLAVLRHADPADKAEVYRQLGLRLTYNHETQTVLAETRPTPPMGLLVVSEGGLAH